MLTLTLTIFNTFFLILLTFWLVNKDCLTCHQEKPPKRIFTGKPLCQTCEEENHA